MALLKKRKEGQRKSGWQGAFLCLTLFLPLLLTSCGETGGGTVIGGHGTIIQEKKEPDKKDEEEESAEAVEAQQDLGGLYIIEEMNMKKETITLYSLSTGTMLRYSWSLTTRFLDRFGQSSSWSNFVPGQVVHIGDLLTSGALSSVQLSPRVWVQDQIVNFDLDTVTGVLQIAGEEYHLSKDVAVFAGEEISAAEAIGDKDTLRVVGLDDEVYSIAVTTGHGYVKLENTELFDGSLLQIGSKVITTVYEGAVIEVMEGTYPVTAANKGYGDTKEYSVEKNATTVIDMKELEGDGPKTCELSFKIEVENAVVELDNEEVNPEEVLEVSYGRHSLAVSAPGYEDWERTLVVNSAKATIELNLTENGSGTNTANNSGPNTVTGGNAVAATGSAAGRTGSSASETSSGSSGSAAGASGNSSSGSSGSNSGNSSQGSSNTSSGTGNSNNGNSDNIRNAGGSAATNYQSEISDRAQAEVDYLTTMSSLLSDLFDSD